ncbi:ABC transporter ATP-binding protein [Marinilabiliaceae bacterium ANBcel2]|nr:ABC transporter ATP-binding protein [Marinilabiliaceae bacterium ANBcel2]
MVKSRRQISTILKYIWRSSPGWTLINIVFVFIRGFLPLLLLFLVKLLVDEIQTIMQLPVDQRELTTVMPILFVAAAIFLVNAVSASLSKLIREKQSFAITDFFDNLIHDKIGRLQYGYFEHPEYQSVFYRALNEAAYRPSRIFYGVVGLSQNFITIIVLGGVLVMVHWSVLLILIAVTIPITVIRLFHARKLFRFKKRHTVMEREVNYYNRLLTAPEFAKEVRVFDLGSLFRRRYYSLKERWRKAQYKMLANKTQKEFIVQLVVAATFFGIYSLIALRAFSGDITIGEVVLYFMALQRGYSYLQQLLGQITALYGDSLFLDNLFEFLNLKESKDAIAVSSIDRAAEKDFPAQLKEGIEFKNIDFHYPSNSRWVLKDLSFNVKAGETVAIVGSNGCGKSTLVKLLCSLYLPVKGDITIDGVNLQSISPSQRISNIGVIFQDFILYNVTAAENVWFGDVRRKKDQFFIREAAQLSGIDGVISSFKKGYNTTMGTLFEGSEPLSPGQWQRLALARTFYNDAQIVILDEPTSSLDAFSEARLLKYIFSLTKGRTSIIISHRLSTIKMADRIVVVDDKRVVETGSYDELMQKEGSRFKEMVNSLSDFSI